MVRGSTASRLRTRDRNACVSVHDMPILRRATLVTSFSTWTLIIPPSPINLSAWSAFAASPDAIYRNTLLSKKLPGIRLFPIELEVGGQATTEGSKSLQQLLTPGFVRDGEFTAVGDVDFDLVALLQLQCFDHGGGKADGQAVAPFRDLHEDLNDIRVMNCISPRPESRLRSMLLHDSCNRAELGDGEFLGP